MSSCVTISADNCHAGESATLLRSDDVNDALIRVSHGKQGESIFRSIVTKNLHLLCRDWVCDWQMNISCRNVVIFSCNSEVGTTQWATS